jgi:glutamyl-tRNA synthetase
VLGTDGHRLSKRNGVVSVNWYRHEGFLPEAVANYLALLGWSPGDNREEFTLAELAGDFDLARVNKNPAQFDVRKLEAINGDKIRGLGLAEFVGRITPFLQRAGAVGDPVTEAEAELIAAAAPLIQTRISRLTQAVGMLDFLFGTEAGFKVHPEDAEHVLTPEARPVLAAAQAALEHVPSWTEQAIEDALRSALTEPGGLGLKAKKAFAPVRVAVTGHRVAPPLFGSLQLLGRERTLARLASAVKATSGG